MTYDLPMADQEEPHRERTHTGPVLVRLAKIDPVEPDWRSSVMGVGHHSARTYVEHERPLHSVTSVTKQELSSTATILIPKLTPTGGTSAKQTQYRHQRTMKSKQLGMRVDGRPLPIWYRYIHKRGRQHRTKKRTFHVDEAAVPSLNIWVIFGVSVVQGYACWLHWVAQVCAFPVQWYVWLAHSMVWEATQRWADIQWVVLWIVSVSGYLSPGSCTMIAGVDAVIQSLGRIRQLVQKSPRDTSRTEAVRQRKADATQLFGRKKADAIRLSSAETKSLNWSMTADDGEKAVAEKTVRKWVLHQ